MACLLAVLAGGLLAAGCTCHLPVAHGANAQSRFIAPLHHRGAPRICLEQPALPRVPAAVILYVTGDAGWFGASKIVFAGLARAGYPAAGFSARDYLRHVGRESEAIAPAHLAEDLATILDTAQLRLGWADDTPVILVGTSRGAGFMAAAAEQPALRTRTRGLIALSLTPETDYVRHRRRTKTNRASTLEDGRILTFARLREIHDFPVAVIQSTHDRYLSADAARAAFGPDTPSRRLYAVEAASHGFRGGREALVRDLEDALRWIVSGTAGG